MACYMIFDLKGKGHQLLKLVVFFCKKFLKNCNAFVNNSKNVEWETLDAFNVLNHFLMTKMNAIFMKTIWLSN